MEYRAARIIITAWAVLMLIFCSSCEKEEVTNFDFSGVWNGELCGSEHQLIITNSMDGVVLYGIIYADVQDNSFSGTIDGITYSGVYIDGVLHYEQSKGAFSCSGDFTKQ